MTDNSRQCANPGVSRRSKLSELSISIQAHFENLADARSRKVVSPLIDVVVIVSCALIKGANYFVAIENFGQKKMAWFEKLLDLSAGIPSHDRLNAFFNAINPAEFDKSFGWITDLHEVSFGQVIAIHGKTLRRSFVKANSK